MNANFKAAVNFKKHLYSIFVRNPASLRPLDGVRALSLLWVIAYHTSLFFQFLATDDFSPKWANSSSNRFAANGDLGVDMFFILSGFLIADVLLKEHKKQGKISYLRFLKRRFLRLWPSLAMCALLSFLWASYILTKMRIYTPSMKQNFVDVCTYKQVWRTLLFINNFFTNDFGVTGCSGQTWSTAVEFQFYLFSPLFIFIYTKNRIAGWVSTVGLILVSLASNAGISFSLNMVDQWAVDFADVKTKFYDNIYGMFYTRSCVYGIGFLLCFLYHERILGKRQNVKMESGANLQDPTQSGLEATLLSAGAEGQTTSKGSDEESGWKRFLAVARSQLNFKIMLAMGLCFFLAYLGDGISSDMRVPLNLPADADPRTDSRLFAALTFAFIFYRFLFGLAVALVLYECLAGRGGLVNWFLSQKIWYPIASLSYTGYLVQFFFIFSVLLGLHPVPLNLGYLVVAWLCNILCSLGFGSLITVFVEKPFMALR